VAERTVLVTGASGFLGRHVSLRLLAAGWRVRGLVRPGRAPAQGVEPAPAAGLDDADALAGAVAGVDAVVHLAARVHVMRDRAADPLSEFRRVNVEGTRALLDAAIAAGARTFVFASSAKAVGEWTSAPWTEETEPCPADPYGLSKLEAERLVLQRAAGTGTAATVLRLPLVYGPGVRANMLKLFDSVWRGVPLPFRGIQNRRTLLFSGNAAVAVEAVLASPAAAGETFFVSDGRSVSTPELVELIAAALGRRARLLPLPLRLLRLAARAGDVLARALPFPLTTAAVDRLTGSLEVDASRLTRVTGFVPPYTMEQGLAETAAWYRSTREAA
jgi:nucleoside-diphosphate-sugar epimerase